MRTLRAELGILQTSSHGSSRARSHTGPDTQRIKLDSTTAVHHTITHPGPSVK